MGKKKKFTPRKASKETQKDNSLSHSDNSDDSDDEVNHFHSNKDKELFNKSSLSKDLDSDEDDNRSDDEIMPFEEQTSDDDSDDNQFKGLNRFAVELQKDDMASDLDDSEEDLPDTNAWGNKKNAFYNTDYVDKDFRNNKQKDEDLALYEEEEALAIQKRLLESISESDVGINLLVGNVEPQRVSSDNLIDDVDKDEEQQRLHINLENLTKRQMLDILKKESPEFEALVNDFKTYSNEIKERLLPVIEAIKRRELSDVFAVKYIETRFHVLINYCTNICFYMALKAKRVSVKEHPVIKQILSFKKLLVELNSMEEKNPNVGKEVDSIAEKLKSENEINSFVKQLKRKNLTENSKNSKKVKFSDHLNEFNELSKKEGQESEELTKRGITYEISKNKGLTPKRKKELKNPRVKHRMKYRKAKIRRKGQVREPRKEVARYGGELSGIKSGVVKSVKFK